MCDDRTVIKVYMGKPDGGRKEERPKLRWLDCIENDLKLMGIKRLKKKTEDTYVQAIIWKKALVTL
jgi:hypothetical protein